MTIDSMHEPAAMRRPWSLAQRVVFRFAFAYLVLYSFPFPISVIPGGYWINAAYDGVWYAFVPWIGKHVLHLAEDVTVFPNGSGDTTFNYVQVLCVAVLAAVATLVWSLLDRKRTEYARLHDGLRIYVRYVLAFAMLSYGMSKVFKLQFAYPGLNRLMQPLGEMSPMGLLWTFMGYSTPYTIFAGMGEVVGGVLVFFRRTTTLGALVVAAVMANVVVLNFSYDVPVKLYSTHLFLMAIFLLVPETTRLCNFFLRNRAVEPVALRPFALRGWRKTVGVTAKVLLIVFALLSNLLESLESRTVFGDAAPAHPLYGLYEVENARGDGEEDAAKRAATSAWRRVIVSKQGNISILTADGSERRFWSEPDPEKHTLSLFTRARPDVRHELTYAQPEPDRLILDGTLEDVAILAQLHKLEPPRFRLVDREFHWINEYPYNW